MGVKGFREPFPWEKGSQKKFPKKCPFCGKVLGKAEFIKRKVKKYCKCKNCGKMVFDVWEY